MLVLVGDDYPDYTEAVDSLQLPGVSPAALEMADPQYHRLSLVDIETVPFLPKGLSVYQTVSTGVDLPVSVNFVVDRRKNAWCFNPEIPYCSDFDLLNRWFHRAGMEIDTEEEAGTLARFVVEMGTSTVHHPNDFLFFRLRQKFGVEYWNFMMDIEDIYEEHKAPYRTEPERDEYETIMARYKERVQPVTLSKVDDGYELHGFTYKKMKAAGDLREWTVTVRRDGTVKVDMKTLERGIGEVSWPWAP